MGIVRPEFNVVGLYPEEVYASNQDATIAAGYRRVEKASPHSTPLAVVGGGPSIKKHVFELVNWPGHIWGVNQSAQWLAGLGRTRDVWMFTVDPDPRMASMADGVERAILGGSCHPDLFAKFKPENLRYFLTRAPKGAKDEPSKVQPKAQLQGPASVTRVFLPAAVMGYVDITFFGCEGCIDEDTLQGNACRNDYALGYRSQENPRLMVIRAGGKEYLTTPDYYITTRALSDVLKAYPKLKEKSGGMLRAMLDHPDTWSCVAVSTYLAKQLYNCELEPYPTPFDVPVECLA